MPVFPIKCLACGEEYEILTKYDPTGEYASEVCPKCGSAKKEKQVYTCSFRFANPVGTDIWRKSHDYRFNWNLPRVKAEREAAEKAAKGDVPYNDIDDINSGDHFGEVK